MDNKENNISQFEIEDLEEKAEELSNIDDFWYFIRSASGAWIAGSAN